MPQSEAKIRYRNSEKGKATLRRYNAKYYSENREELIARKIAYHRNRRYGISEESYQSHFQSQNGVCLLCEDVNASGRRLAVDHDHKTGKIRGLLCDRCNRGIGFFRENTELMEKAIAYLCRTQT